MNPDKTTSSSMDARGGEPAVNLPGLNFCKMTRRKYRNGHLKLVVGERSGVDKIISSCLVKRK